MKSFSLVILLAAILTYPMVLTLGLLCDDQLRLTGEQWPGAWKDVRAMSIIGTVAMCSFYWIIYWLPISK